MNLYRYELNSTKKNELISIDDFLNDAIKKSKVKNGLAIVFTAHTTAGITINENCDDDVKSDLLYGLEKISPKRDEYKHFEENSDAHLKSSIIGASESIIIAENKPIMGRWQGLYFCEFDGARRRTIFIKILTD
ncbi:MAG: secondary thiamine-phosphate synthase enzyme YjbQ [Tissierellia bacterium]|nr:secondary thiamine-phosphate synthase enzyme YjbQ [Tissierellia bacterium]